jgi:hypothetical protein
MSSLPLPTPPQATGAVGPVGLTDAQGVVVGDIACRKCTYNLRGLSLGGRCPECGSAVGLSVQGDLMRYAHPTWVRTLQRGVVFILVGIAVIVLGVVVSMVMGAVNGPMLIAQGVMLIGNLLSVYGAWLLTEPDPGGIGEERYGTSRKIIRVALAVGLGSTLIQLISERATSPPPVMMGLVVIAGLAGLVGLVGQFAQLNYISKIATRIPDERITKRARLLMWGVGITYGLLLLLGLAVALGALTGLMGGGGGPLLMGMGCVGGIAGLGLLVFGIMYLLMLDALRVRLGQEALTAETSWARMEAGEAAVSAPAAAV